MPGLSLSLLGPLKITLDRQPVMGFQSNKVRALLIFLVVEADRPHARESLATLLWPDYPDSLTYLRNALSNLRQVIGDSTAQPPYLIVTRDVLQLNPKSSISIDLRDFIDLTGKKGEPRDQIESLKTALDLCRGSFLEGFACDSAEFEEWTLAWRERINRERRAVLGKLSLAYAESGRHELSIQAAQNLLELEPWDEAAHRLIMQGLAKSGQRGAALAQYETCRKVLKTGLGVEPSAETQALAQSIRAEEVNLPPFTEAVLPTAQPHLPTPLTSFIGRKEELAEVLELLGCYDKKEGSQLRLPSPSDRQQGPARLVTLCGAGGCGKTRLALAVGKSATEEKCFRNGVWWVSLSSITEADQVLPTVASAFGLSDILSVPCLNHLIDYLRERDLLLLLDNSEHLIEATALLVEKLLEQCPSLHILVTSREPLGVPGEVIWRVPGLTVPEQGSMEQASLEAVRRYDAVRLFEERAQAVMPGWALEGNTVGVVEICRRLDGIPLAIELAAGRVRMLTVEQINARLGDLFNFLTGGGRTALPRHQTLRACIDWSYNLLTPEEKRLLRRLSVFNGGWTLEAAEDVEDAEVLDLLTHLADRSLVMVEETKDQGMRYRLLDTIHQYAREKLIEAGESDCAQRAHLAYFNTLAASAGSELRGHQQMRWMARLKLELGNLRAALQFALTADPTAALSISTDLFWFWFMCDLTREGQKWLEIALAANPSPEYLTAPADILLRAWALCREAFLKLNVLCLSARQTKELSTEEELNQAAEKIFARLEESIRLFHGLGKPGLAGEAWAMRQLGYYYPDPKRKRDLLEESLRLSRQSGDSFVTAECLSLLGEVVAMEGDHQRAAALWSEALAGYHEVGDLGGAAWVKFQMADVSCLQKDFTQAQTLYGEALPIYQVVGQKVMLFWTRYGLASVALARGDFERARRDCDAMLAIARDTSEEDYLALGLVRSGQALLGFDPDQAYVRLLEALAIYRKTGNQTGQMMVLDGFAGIFAARGHPDRAARLLGLVLQSYHHKSMFYVPSHKPVELARLEPLRAQLQLSLGKEAFEEACAEGEAMTLEQALEYATRDG